MAETESVDKRPACDWPVTTKKESSEVTEACKSEKNVFKVTSTDESTGRPGVRDICGRHFEREVWGKQGVESAEKYQK